MKDAKRHLKNNPIGIMYEFLDDAKREKRVHCDDHSGAASILVWASQAAPARTATRGDLIVLM